MAFKNGYRLWDNEYIQAHWSPEEIAESNARVAHIGEIIDAERNGEISHDEAMIRHLMLDPDLLENMLDDAYGDPEQVKRVRAWSKEAKNRTRENRYWASLLRHAQKTVQNGYNVEPVLHALNEAVSLIKTATTTGTSL